MSIVARNPDMPVAFNLTSDSSSHFLSKALGSFYRVYR